MTLLLAPRPGERVVDFCAGGGGKTLHASALMDNRGSLYAFDVSERRLERMRKRLARAGASNVRVLALASERDPRLQRHRDHMDAVLVDAPCTGSGTLRRNPDMKWRTWDFAALSQQQAIHPRRGRAARPSRRAPRLRDLQPARRGERGDRRGVPRRARRIRRAAGRGRARRARHRRPARRNAGRSPAAPSAPPRYRRILRRPVRATAPVTATASASPRSAPAAPRRLSTSPRVGRYAMAGLRRSDPRSYACAPRPNDVKLTRSPPSPPRSSPSLPAVAHARRIARLHGPLDGTRRARRLRLRRRPDALVRRASSCADPRR